MAALVGLLVLGGLTSSTISATPAGAIYYVPGPIASARDVNGRLVTVTVTYSDAFGRGPASDVRAWRQACAGCGWESIGSIGWFLFGTPALSLAPDGRLELIGSFAWYGAPPALRVVRETCPGCGFAGSPPLAPEAVAAEMQPFDGPPPPVGSENLAVATNPDGRRELFTTAGDGGVWHSWEWCPGCGWSAWEPLGLPGGGPAAGSPAVAANADGRLEVFVRSGGVLWHSWQWCGGGCGWSAWAPASDVSSGAVQTDAGVGLNADGRLEVFAGIGDVLHHSWQECPGCGWSPWVPVDGSPSVVSQHPMFVSGILTPSIAVVRNADGRLEVFFESVSGTHHVWQICAGCGWGPTVPLAP